VNKMKKRIHSVFLFCVLFFNGIILNAYSVTLIGQWDFEEGSGTTAYDSSVNMLNGAIYNASYTEGIRGNYALDFNGSSSYVEIPYSPLLNPDSISISLWFKPDSYQQGNADILDKGHGYGTTPYLGGYVFQYGGGGSNINAIYGGGTSFYAVGAAGNYKDNAWHHIVANLGTDEMAMYMDGQLLQKIPGQGPILDNDSPLYIGRHRYLGRYFNGLVDDIQIYDAALSQQNVTMLYKAGAIVPEPTTLFLFGISFFSVFLLKRNKRVA
jgi:hypothetical protein